MHASESPPPNSFKLPISNSSSFLQTHYAATAATATALLQGSSDTNTNTDTDIDTPDTLTTTTSINHIKNNKFTLAPPHKYQQHGIHCSVRRVSSIESLRLVAAQGSIAVNGSLTKRPYQSAPARAQQPQKEEQLPRQHQKETGPLLSAPTPLAPRFHFAQFWSSQRLFSVVRPTSPSSQPPSPLPTAVVTGESEGGGRTTLTPTPPLSLTSTSKTVSKSSSSSSMRSLVAQCESRGQSSRRSSLSVKPVSATTTVSLGESNPVSELSLRRQQDTSSSQSREALASFSAKFTTLPIQRSGSNDSDMSSDSNSGVRVHKSGRSSSVCYPSPTSPNRPPISTALDRVQKRISQGQAQLLQYTNMIQKHDTDRIEYLALQASNQKERATLENEIEVIENAIRQCSSTLISPLSSFFSSASTAAGGFWSPSSPPLQSCYGDDCYTGQDACCPFKAMATAAAGLSSAGAPSSSLLSPTVTPTTDFPCRSSAGTQPPSSFSNSPSFSRYSSSAPLPLPDTVPRPPRSRSTSSLHLCYTAPTTDLPNSASNSTLSSHHSDHQPQRDPYSSPSTQSRLPPSHSSLQPLPTIPSVPTASSRASAAESTLPSPLSSSPSSPMPRLPSPLQPKSPAMCRRCYLKTTLKTQQEQLRALQRRIDQVQQKIHSTTSHIRHLQRTFVLPIEACLKEDMEDLERVQRLRVVSTGGRGGGGGGGGAMHRRA